MHKRPEMFIWLSVILVLQVPHENIDESSQTSLFYYVGVIKRISHFATLKHIIWDTQDKFIFITFNQLL